MSAGVRLLLQLGLLFLPLSSLARAQCPEQLQAPCTCSSTRYEAVSVVCDRGTGLEAVLRALSSPPAFIDSLVISNTPVDSLPGLAFQGLNIKKLVLRNNGLRQIHPQAFNGGLLDTLVELEIRGNFLESVPQAGLPQIRKLQTLILADNQISKIVDHTFLSYHSRTSLKRLDLSANNISYLEPLALLGLEVLEQLSFDKNLLTAIPTETLKHLPTLEDLSLGVNLIESIPVGALPLPSLKSLSLEVNKIKSIPADAFQQVSGLLYLYLGNNLFSTIDSTAFFYINQLKVLAMGNNNRITTISDNAFQYVPLLVRLELSDCSITHIEPSAFHKIPKVQVVVLSRNQLSHIHHSTFSSMPEIVSIDLNHNVISVIDDFAFSQLPALSYLDLSGNRLETLPPNVLYDTLLPRTPPQARILYLYDNPWKCDADLVWLRKWLRNNGDVQITAPGGQATRCWTPSHLNGLDLRQTDPVQNIAETAILISQRMNKLARPSQQFPPSSGHNDFQLPPTTVSAEEAQISGFNLVVLILSIVLGLLTVCILLLTLIRCAMKKSKSRADDRRDLGSASVNSGFGSLYGTGLGYHDQTLHGHRAGSLHDQAFNLNRPWYWWF